MDNKELAEKIAKEIVNHEIMNFIVILPLHGSALYREHVTNGIVDIALKNLNAHYQTQSIPAVSSLPTTCDEPGIAC